MSTKLLACLSHFLFLYLLLEDLRVFSVFSEKGLLSWKVGKTISKITVKGGASKIYSLIMNDQPFKYSLVLKLILSCLLFFISLYGIISSLLFCSLFLLHALIFVRTPYSLDGAYQMSLVVLFSLSLGSISGTQSNSSSLCLYYIAIQLIISYFISGYSKLLSIVWRKGYAANLVFSTKIYGHSLIHNMVQHRPTAYALCWCVMVFESLFFLSIFMAPSFSLFFIACSFFFHLANAIFMGLNNFLFSFSSTYPSLIYLIIKING